MIVLGMLIMWVMRLISETASVGTDAMGPAALWIALLFPALLAQERSFAIEEQEDCISALLLAPVDAGTIYLAKLLANIAILCIFEIIAVPIVLVVFDLHISGRWLGLIVTLLLINVGISSVGTLFSAMVQLSRAKGALLSILVLVILLPVMIPATFALLWLFGFIAPEEIGSSMLFIAGDFGTAVGYIAAFDAIFTTSCWMLFGFVVRQ